jgi:hypothetical protein
MLTEKTVFDALPGRATVAGAAQPATAGSDPE